MAMNNAAASSALHLDVFVAPYRQIVAQVPSMGVGEPTWPGAGRRRSQVRRWSHTSKTTWARP
jgi:hypothetical protein